MTEPAYDLVIRGGRVATASDVFDADVAITGETIAAIGRGLPPGKREIDARGKLVLPGGVDSHAHIEQLSAAGMHECRYVRKRHDLGGFRRHHDGDLLRRPARRHGAAARSSTDYHALANKGAVIDYAFHMIIADPTRKTLREAICRR